MVSDFETVIAKCDGCKYEEKCREMPPCILDAYNKGREDAIDEFVTYLKNYMWWSNEADEKVIGEFALEEYAERIKR